MQLKKGFSIGTLCVSSTMPDTDSCNKSQANWSQKGTTGTGWSQGKWFVNKYTPELMYRLNIRESVRESKRSGSRTKRPKVLTHSQRKKKKEWECYSNGKHPSYLHTEENVGRMQSKEQKP